MPNPFGFPRISEVTGLAEIPSSRSSFFDQGGTLYWRQAPEFIARADGDLGLAGELMQFAQTHDISFQKIGPLPDAARESAFWKWSRSGLWRAYSDTGHSGVRYTIIVDYHDYSEMVLTNEEMKAHVMKFAQKELTRLLLVRDSVDPLSSIMAIGQKVMYEFGIPNRKMGFFHDCIKTMSRFEPLGPERER